jgi:hypothetical protein
MYFKEFPKFIYDFKYGKETRTSIVTDITRNVRFRKEVLDNISLYDEYDIMEGETPEIIAEKVYGNSMYHWIIMLANQRYDYLTDFPITDQGVERASAIMYNPPFTAPSTAFSYVGRDVSVNLPYAHGIQVSPITTVTVSGTSATTNAPNGTFTITAVTPTQIRFRVTTAPTGTISGTNIKLITSGRERYTHHWEVQLSDSSNDWHIVNSDYVGATAVSNLEYEFRQNNKKRRIKLIAPEVVAAILKQYKEAL